ncbi:hypothetical protein J4573_30920 [Actinomadura barringtoniae]|uniref:DUF320 domain-containing protein n=1 Tax=Actinomadura barringtoniae TaxID=1427535 RepID=A0A939TCR8_9ACTN|nr:hypothetical protein [Actinomadura barringtoniae]MBO2451540.1 hypothetical protein [Actinomadura barringtoniae]
MIKTALKTGAVTATIAGATFMAGPAMASPHNHNHGNAIGNTVNVTIVGGYGVTCGSVSVAGQAGTNCNHNGVKNHSNASDAGGNSG